LKKLLKILVDKNFSEDDDWETRQKYAKSTNQTVNSSGNNEPGLYRRFVDNYVNPFIKKKDGYETIIIISIFVFLYLISYFSADE